MAISEMVRVRKSARTDLDGHGHGTRIGTREYSSLGPEHGLGHGIECRIKSATSMLVTDVGDEMCW